MLRITRQTDYGIVLMTCFAGHPERVLASARDLATETGYPLPTVSKSLKVLARAGLLRSHRGAKGGYSLAKPAHEISVAEIIAALEGPIAITECLTPTTDDCSYESVCPCRTNWTRINDAIRNALEAVPLSEMTTQFALPARPVAEPADAEIS